MDRENKNSVARRGRPTKYREEYTDQAYKLCLLGARDEDLADFFEVHVDTIYEWKKVHDDFSEALKNGKIKADADVAERLYKRATGYECPETKVFCHEGQITCFDIVKHYPPDPTSIIFWLKNRQPEKWRDKQDHEHSGNLAVFVPDMGDKKLEAEPEKAADETAEPESE